MIRFFYVMLLLGLTACSTTGDVGKNSGSSFSFFNTYDSALSDYTAGRVMEARKRVLAMDKTREDYGQAKRLLNNKIEPARVRLLKHYSRKAKAAEKKRDWSQAMRFYEQTTGFSTQPAKWRKKQVRMEMKFRQLRMNALLAQRRQEDSSFLSWVDAYDVPRGVAAKDKVFEKMHDRIQGLVASRSNLAYVDATRYVNRGLIEIAYIEIESYLRLNPNSGKGQRLLLEIKKSMPKGIYIASVKSRKKSTSKHLSKRRQKIELVTASQIKALMDKRRWVKAKEFALVYRREGGKDADRILKRIEVNTEKDAASLFAKGRGAFRSEKLKQAVEYWSQAVTLMPNESEYVDALQRAQQLQDRLKVLKADEGSSKKK